MRADLELAERLRHVRLRHAGLARHEILRRRVPEADAQVVFDGFDTRCGLCGAPLKVTPRNDYY
jgi:hypothetical protein